MLGLLHEISQRLSQVFTPSAVEVRAIVEASGQERKFADA
jgi:hypothetical protein